MTTLAFALLPLAGQAQPRDLGREVLPARDGWASMPTAELSRGTVGGSEAAPVRDVVVSARDELIRKIDIPRYASMAVTIGAGLFRRGL